MFHVLVYAYLIVTQFIYTLPFRNMFRCYPAINFSPWCGISPRLLYLNICIRPKIRRIRWFFIILICRAFFYGKSETESVYRRTLRSNHSKRIGVWIRILLFLLCFGICFELFPQFSTDLTNPPVSLMKETCLNSFIIWWYF